MTGISNHVVVSHARPRKFSELLPLWYVQSLLAARLLFTVIQWGVIGPALQFSRGQIY